MQINNTNRCYNSSSVTFFGRRSVSPWDFSDSLTEFSTHMAIPAASQVATRSGGEGFDGNAIWNWNPPPGFRRYELLRRVFPHLTHTRVSRFNLFRGCLSSHSRACLWLIPRLQQNSYLTPSPLLAQFLRKPFHLPIYLSLPALEACLHEHKYNTFVGGRSFMGG